MTTSSDAASPEPTADTPAKKTAKKTARKSAKKTAGGPAKKTGKKTAAKSARKAATRTTNTSATKAAPRASSRPQPSPLQVASKAAGQLVELLGREPEGVTGLEKTEDGWAVQVEVLELRRIPATTDVLGLYEVRTDGGGDLTGYRRLRRYARGASDDE